MAGRRPLAAVVSLALGLLHLGPAAKAELAEEVRLAHAAEAERLLSEVRGVRAYPTPLPYLAVLQDALEQASAAGSDDLVQRTTQRAQQLRKEHIGVAIIRASKLGPTDKAMALEASSEQLLAAFDGYTDLLGSTGAVSVVAELTDEIWGVQERKESRGHKKSKPEAEKKLQTKADTVTETHATRLNALRQQEASLAKAEDTEGVGDVQHQQVLELVNEARVQQVACRKLPHQQRLKALVGVRKLLFDARDVLKKIHSRTDADAELLVSSFEAEVVEEGRLAHAVEAERIIDKVEADHGVLSAAEHAKLLPGHLQLLSTAMELAARAADLSISLRAMRVAEALRKKSIDTAIAKLDSLADSNKVRHLEASMRNLLTVFGRHKVMFAGSRCRNGEDPFSKSDLDDEPPETMLALLVDGFAICCLKSSVRQWFKKDDGFLAGREYADYDPQAGQGPARFYRLESMGHGGSDLVLDSTAFDRLMVLAEGAAELPQLQLHIGQTNVSIVSTGGVISEHSEVGNYLELLGPLEGKTIYSGTPQLGIDFLVQELGAELRRVSKELQKGESSKSQAAKAAGAKGRGAKDQQTTVAAQKRQVAELVGEAASRTLKSRKLPFKERLQALEEARKMLASARNISEASNASSLALDDNVFLNVTQAETNLKKEVLQTYSAEADRFLAKGQKLSNMPASLPHLSWGLQSAARAADQNISMRILKLAEKLRRKSIKTVIERTKNLGYHTKIQAMEKFHEHMFAAVVKHRELYVGMKSPMSLVAELTDEMRRVHLAEAQRQLKLAEVKKTYSEEELKSLFAGFDPATVRATAHQAATEAEALLKAKEAAIKDLDPLMSMIFGNMSAESRLRSKIPTNGSRLVRNRTAHLLGAEAAFTKGENSLEAARMGGLYVKTLHDLVEAKIAYFESQRPEQLVFKELHEVLTVAHEVMIAAKDRGLRDHSYSSIASVQKLVDFASLAYNVTAQAIVGGLTNFTGDTARGEHLRLRTGKLEGDVHAYPALFPKPPSRAFLEDAFRQQASRGVKELIREAKREKTEEERLSSLELVYKAVSDNANMRNSSDLRRVASALSTELVSQGSRLMATLSNASGTPKTGLWDRLSTLIIVLEKAELACAYLRNPQCEMLGNTTLKLASAAYNEEMKRIIKSLPTEYTKRLASIAFAREQLNKTITAHTRLLPKAPPPIAILQVERQAHVSMGWSLLNLPHQEAKLTIQRAEQLCRLGGDIACVRQAQRGQVEQIVSEVRKAASGPEDLSVLGELDQRLGRAREIGSALVNDTDGGRILDEAEQLRDAFARRVNAAEALRILGDVAAAKVLEWGLRAELLDRARAHHQAAYNSSDEGEVRKMATDAESAFAEASVASCVGALGYEEKVKVLEGSMENIRLQRQKYPQLFNKGSTLPSIDRLHSAVLAVHVDEAQRQLLTARSVAGNRKEHFRLMMRAASLFDAGEQPELAKQVTAEVRRIQTQAATDEDDSLMVHALVGGTLCIFVALGFVAYMQRSKRQDPAMQPLTRSHRQTPAQSPSAPSLASSTPQPTKVNAPKVEDKAKTLRKKMPPAGPPAEEVTAQAPEEDKVKNAAKKGDPPAQQATRPHRPTPASSVLSAPSSHDPPMAEQGLRSHSPGPKTEEEAVRRRHPGWLRPDP